MGSMLNASALLASVRLDGTPTVDSIDMRGGVDKRWTTAAPIGSSLHIAEQATLHTN